MSFLLDREGRIATWSDGARDLFAHRTEQIVGRHVSALVPGELARTEAPHRTLVAAIEHGHHVGEGWLVREDGTRFWADVTTTALPDERGPSRGFTVVVRDLTARRSVESRYDAERAALEAVFVQAPACICVLRGPEHVFELANPAYVALLGGRGITGLPVREAVPELAAQGFVELLDRVFRTGEPFVGKEMPARIERADGTSAEVFFDFVYQPIRAADGTSDGIIAFGFDVTEQVVARRRLKRAHHEREKILADLHDAVMARDEFLAVASHELKTPLTPLQLQLDAIKAALGKAGLTGDPVCRKLEQAARQTERLHKLVEKLLDVWHVTSGDFHLELERVDLGEVISAVAELFADDARRAGSTIEVTAGAGAIGRWDRLRLELVVGNLVSNAIKYGRGRPIAVHLHAAGGSATLTVRDHGIGVAAADRGRIFERFERGVSLRNYGGLGLGLFITRRIVDAHGGSIAVDGAPGGGSTFTVVLPIADPT